LKHWLQDSDRGEVEEANQVDKKKKKFPADLGPKLAFLSLLALILSSLSGVWFALLQNQPLYVSAGLSAFHLGIVLSLGQSFLPRHFSVWCHSTLLGITLACGKCCIIDRVFGHYFGIQFSDTQYKRLNTTLGINDIQHNETQHASVSAISDECCDYLNVMLSVVVVDLLFCQRPKICPMFLSFT
jgi:hypothetical protein